MVDGNGDGPHGGAQRSGDERVVEARGLTRAYEEGGRRVPVLRGLDLDVARGEFVAVMGPSGSGKSTLLHLLAGLDLPDAGRLVVAGRALATLSDDERTVLRRRSIGVVFQAFNLIPTLTAEENVALPLLLDGLAMRQASARVRDALAAVEMLARRTHTPDRLSGGEQQRVAVARALVIDPVLVLADEPTGNLDSRAADAVLALFDRAVDRRRAIVMVTHDPRAAAHAARVVRVVDGVVAPCVDEAPVLGRRRA